MPTSQAKKKATEGEKGETHRKEVIFRLALVGDGRLLAVVPTNHDVLDSWTSNSASSGASRAWD